MNQFPKWKYHATQAAQIVESAEAEEDLSLGWHDTPADAMRHEFKRLEDEAADKKAEAFRLADEALRLAEENKAAEALRLSKVGAPGTGTGAADDEAAKADAEIYRKELLAQAKEKGLTLHHLTGAEKILAAIAAHDADQSA